MINANSTPELRTEQVGMQLRPTNIDLRIICDVFDVFIACHFLNVHTNPSL